MFGNPLYTEVSFDAEGALIISAQKTDMEHQDNLSNRLNLRVQNKDERYFVTGDYSKSNGAHGQISFDISANRDLTAVRGDFGLYLHGQPWDDIKTISTLQDSIVGNLQFGSIKSQIDELGR